jgi:hypothetical protein
MSATPKCIVVVSVPTSKARFMKMLRYRLETKTCFKRVRVRFVSPPIGEEVHVVVVENTGFKAGQSRRSLIMRLMQGYLDEFVEEVSEIRKQIDG